ncbi:MAG: hypothetical protein A2Y97_09500 [Nitrospirae bacterium RBG_13_39_12]|nr:MAG: hypothetical protein A2Y97_09500 [Nitrospirae bacterium RBG_13_39_12]
MLTFIYSCLCTEFSGGAYSYATQYLEKLPIRRINFQTSQANRTSLFKQGASLYGAYLANQSCDNIVRFTEQRLLSDPEESDVVHDLLAYLAEHMIEMNCSRQKEVKRFFAWIEKVLNVQPDNKGNDGIDALAGKSTIKSYMGDYQKNEDALSFDGLMNILHKNRAHIGVSLSDNKITSRLKSEYDKSLTILLPIKENLKKTDWLIDQIVYKLYGLTEEEIKIVEERDLK